MLTPLNQFVCDTCKQVIERPEDGWVEWLNTEENEVNLNSGFRIIHHVSRSPKLEHNSYGCSKYSGKQNLCDMPLINFLNPNSGLAELLSLIDIGSYHIPTLKQPLVRDIREYIEFVRRLTIPHYEEARLYWSQAISGRFFIDQSPTDIYSSNSLIDLIEHYSGDE